MPAYISPQMISPTLIGAAVGALTNAPTNPATYPVYGLAMRFAVTVDDLSNLGRWATCKGLRVEFKTKTVTEGGDYGAPVALPDRLEYDKITLERAITKEGSAAVQKWLISMKDKWMTPQSRPTSPGRYTGGTAHIQLLNPADPSAPLMKWDFYDVLPVSWTGPSLSGKANEVAMETLVLQHGGFQWTP
jgi:phage tail-like protein